MTFDGDIEYFFLRGEAGKEADARWRDAEVPRKGAGNGFVRLSLHRRFPDGDDVLTIVDLLNNFLPRPRLCVNDDFHSGCGGAKFWWSIQDGFRTPSILYSEYNRHSGNIRETRLFATFAYRIVG